MARSEVLEGHRNSVLQFARDSLDFPVRVSHADHFHAQGPQLVQAFDCHVSVHADGEACGLAHLSHPLQPQFSGFPRQITDRPDEDVGCPVCFGDTGIHGVTQVAPMIAAGPRRRRAWPTGISSAPR